MSVSLLSSSLARGNASTTTAAQEDATTAALNKLSPALGKAHGRLQSQLQSESTSLSQLGKYKAAVSDLSGAAQALSQLSASTSVADNVKVVERFVAAYNQAITASQANASSSAGSTLAASRRALNASDTSRSQLAQLGLARQADGTLKLDATALGKALASGAASGTASGTTSASSTATASSASASGLATLAQLGKAMAKRADSELAGTGRLATATTQLTERAAQLKQQRTQLLEAASQFSSRQSSTGNWGTQQALRKYSL